MKAVSKRRSRERHEMNRAPDMKGGQDFLKEGVIDSDFTMDQSGRRIPLSEEVAAETLRGAVE